MLDGFRPCMQLLIESEIANRVGIFEMCFWRCWICFRPCTSIYGIWNSNLVGIWADIYCNVTLRETEHVYLWNWKLPSYLVIDRCVSRHVRVALTRHAIPSCFAGVYAFLFFRPLLEYWNSMLCYLNNVISKGMNDKWDILNKCLHLWYLRLFCGFNCYYYYLWLAGDNFPRAI